MGFWNSLFKRQVVEVVPVFADDVLGQLDWSDDDEAWVGRHAGLRFSLSFESGNAPTREIVEYARSLLRDSEWLAETLELCKRKALSESPPKLAAEILALEFRTLHFQNSRQLLIQFFEGDEEPFWSADFKGRELTGIGCDS